MSILQSIILGLVQGFTEFLPISSSAHLIIVPEIFKWGEHSLTFDIVVHAGTLVAIIYFYRRRLKYYFTELISKSSTETKLLIRNLILTTFPTILMFLIFQNQLKSKFDSIEVIKYTLIIGGIFLIWADIFSKKHKSKKEISKTMATFIGVGQGISLIRGVSRSGAMLTVGLFSKIERERLIEYVFIASIPIILAGLILEIYHYDPASGGNPEILISGFIASAISGYLAIHILTLFINKNLLVYSGIYRIILALIFFLK